MINGNPIIEQPLEDDIEEQESETPGVVYDFDTREPKPTLSESTEHEKKVLELENALKLLHNDLGQIHDRKILLKDADRYINLIKIISRQVEVNELLIKNTLKLNKLRKDAESTERSVTAMDKLANRMREVLTGQVKKPKGLEEIHGKIDQITQTQIELRRELRDENNKDYNFDSLMAEKKQLIRSLEKRMEMKVGLNFVAFPKEVEVLRAQVNGDWKKISDIAEQIKTLEKELSILKTINT